MRYAKREFVSSVRRAGFLPMRVAVASMRAQMLRHGSMHTRESPLGSEGHT
jgi:hypothetical protein